MNGKKVTCGEWHQKSCDKIILRPAIPRHCGHIEEKLKKNAIFHLIWWLSGQQKIQKIKYLNTTRKKIKIFFEQNNLSKYQPKMVDSHILTKQNCSRRYFYFLFFTFIFGRK